MGERLGDRAEEAAPLRDATERGLELLRQRGVALAGDDDRAIAVGAEVVWIDPMTDRTTLTATLTKAAEKAITRAS